MTSRVVVALRVRAMPAHAFMVFTTQIAVWWRPNSLFAFTPREPGVMSFEGGRGGRLIETRANGEIFEIGEIHVWDPPRKLAFGWRQASFAADQNTQVDVRFEAVGDETRITVEHSGWDSVPPTHAARHGFADVVFLRRHGEWWQALLSACEAAITRNDLGPDD